MIEQHGGSIGAENDPAGGALLRKAIEKDRLEREVQCLRLANSDFSDNNFIYRTGQLRGEVCSLCGECHEKIAADPKKHSGHPGPPHPCVPAFLNG
jgi:hypothetical protein